MLKNRKKILIKNLFETRDYSDSNNQAYALYFGKWGLTF